VRPVLAQPCRQALDRVAPGDVVGALLLIHVAAIVVRRMPVEAQRHRLDGARAAACARLLDRAAHGQERRDRIAAVDPARGDAPTAPRRGPAMHGLTIWPLVGVEYA